MADDDRTGEELAMVAFDEETQSAPTDDGIAGDDLLHRIDAEFAESSEPGFVEISDARPTNLAVNKGDTVSIMEGPYEDNPGSDFASEFDHIMDMHAAAQAASPTNDLDAHVRLEAAKREEENELAPFTCINPVSLYRGNLGQTVTLKPGATLSTSVFADGDPQLVSFWPGDDREVCPVTVTAAPVLPYSSNILRAVAVIKWGVHGAKFEVRIDVGTGFEVTINASNVYLSVYLEGGDFSGSSPADVSDHLVGGAIGFQQSDHQQPVIRSINSNGTIQNGGTFTALRPAFATSLLSFERSDISGPTTLNFLDQNGTIRFVRQYAALAYIGSPISLPGEIASVQVSNGGAGTNLTLVFGLF